MIVYGTMIKFDIFNVYNIVLFLPNNNYFLPIMTKSHASGLE